MELTPEGLIAFVTAMLAGYGVAYFRKRGENLATKQDIAEITRSVETVKSELHVLQEAQVSSMNRQHEALVDFFDAATILAVDKLPRSYADFTADGGAGLREHLDSVNELFSRLLVTYHRLALYFSRDQEVVRAAGELVKAATRLRRGYASTFAGAHIALASVVERMANGAGHDDDVEFVREKAEAYVAATAAPRIALDKAYNDYLAATNRYMLRIGQPDSFIPVSDTAPS